MEKLRMYTSDTVALNLKKLKTLFPSFITESLDKTGKAIESFDFELFRQEFSDVLVEGHQEKYQINWPGKKDALLLANSPIAETLRPVVEESVNFSDTKNIFIQGDNLDALKIIQETYLNKIKMIYIDPPYNTGNDFIYEDDFVENSDSYLKKSNQKDLNGNRMISNSESNGRFHSDWLSMIYPRLKLAWNLLTDDGVIFISIDDGEMANLNKICNELFGESNFVATLIWKSRQTTDSRKSTKVSSDHEYILCYAKNIDNFSMKGKDIDKTKYTNPDNDPRGPWSSIDLSVQKTKDQRPNQFYDIFDPKTGNHYPANPQRVWSKSREVVEQMVSENRIIFPNDINGRPREKKFLSDLKSEQTGFSTSLNSDEVGYTTNGTRDFSALFEDRLFDYPKPVNLLKTLIKQTTDSDSIILDFFAGSGTIGQAVMELNAEELSNRRFIVVQIPEQTDPESVAYKLGHKNIADITKERLRLAGKKIKSENAIAIASLDMGFRVLKVDSSNMTDVYYSPDAVAQDLLSNQADNVKMGRSSEDLLFQVLLDWGVDLSLPIQKETLQNKEVYYVDQNALAACFDNNGGVDEEFVKELANKKPLRVVFRDAGFKSDSVKINVEQIFKLISPSTDVKCI